jgi:hypothetical protein
MQIGPGWLKNPVCRFRMRNISNAEMSSCVVPRKDNGIGEDVTGVFRNTPCQQS